MASFDLPQSLTLGNWNSKAAGLDKSKSAAKSAVDKELGAVQNVHKAIDWSLLEVDKLTSAADIQTRMKDIEAEKKSSLDKLSKQLGVLGKSADDFASKAGKDVDKKILDAAKAIKSEASSQSASIDARFTSALAALAQKLKTAAAKTPAKTATPASAAASPGAAKKAQATASTYRKLGFEAIMKARTKPQLKPSRFMVVEFKKSVRFYMGMKYDKNKTVETLKAMNPKDAYVRVHLDPNSKVIWEKGALTLVSNKIPLKFAKQMTLACKPLLGKVFKIRMRKESGEVVEADDPEAKEVSDAELAAELAKMPADPEADDDEDSVSDDSMEDEAEEAETASSSRAAKSAGQGAAAKTAAPAANGALESVRAQWVATRTSAGKEIDKLFGEIGKLYDGSQKAELDKARKTLDTCMNALGTLDGQLDAVLREKDNAKRAQRLSSAKATAQKLSEFVDSHPVMANLDNNEVMAITAAAKLRASLQQVQAALV
jgi:hypothetical protein